MKLRSKALLIIACMWTAICLAVFVVCDIILKNNFQSAEEKIANRDIARVLNALKNQMESLVLYTNSWAQWDGAYDFMKHPNQEFIKSSFVPGTFTSSSLNFFLFYDTEGKYYYGQAYDLSNNKFMPVPKDLLATLSKEPDFVTHKGSPPKRSGILNLHEGVVILSSLPVLDSDGKLAPRGSLLMGYYLNGKQINDLSKTVEMNLKFYPLPVQKSDAYLTGILAKLLYGNTKTYLKNINLDKVNGYTLVNDLNNNPVGIIEVTIPLFLYKEGMTAIHHFLFGLIVLGITLLITLWYLLKSLVLNRILDISKQVIDINNAGTFEKRINLSGNDELNSMTKSLNSMLEMIELNQVQMHYRISQRTKDLEKITKLNRNLFTEMGKQKAMEAKLIEDKKLLKKNGLFRQLDQLA